MNPKTKSRFELKSFIEKNALVVLVVFVFGASSAIYAVVNGWYEREYKLRATELERQYNDKFTQLETERSRIKLTIEAESKFISPEHVFIEPSELPPNYSVAQGGFFAVPNIQEGKGKWVWAMHSEAEMLGEALGPKQLKDMLPAEQQKLLEKSPLRILCYESQVKEEIQTPQFTIGVRPRATFQRVSWEEFSQMRTDANANAVQGLFDKIDSIGDSIDMIGMYEMVLTSSGVPNEKKIKVLSDTETANELARISLKQPGRADLFLDFVHAHFSQDIADKFSASFKAKQGVNLEQQQKKLAEKKQREQDKIKVEPDKLETFLTLFSAIGSGNAVSPYGNFKATDYTFRKNAFSIQGYYDLASVPGVQSKSITRIYLLNIAMMREDGIYVMGFVYPAKKDFTGLHQLMSLIEGVRILK